MYILVGNRRSEWSRRDTCLPIMPIQAIDGVVMVGTVGIRAISNSEILAARIAGPLIYGVGCCLLQGSLLLAKVGKTFFAHCHDHLCSIQFITMLF